MGRRCTLSPKSAIRTFSTLASDRNQSRARYILNIEKSKEKARKLEAKGQFDKAIVQYGRILSELDGRPELADELVLFNKLGDLYVKQGNISAAVEEYEKAINHYAEQGFPNNAIALCNKVLRNAPGRTHIYLKLAKLMMQRGFASDAKQNLLEYAERMQKAGKLEEAFLALKEFADLSPDNEEIRLILADQLKKAARSEEAHEQLEKLYEELRESGDARRARATLEKMRAIDPEYDLDAAGLTAAGRPKKEKSSDIVFLDLDDDIAPITTADVDERHVKPVEHLEVERTSMGGDVDSLVAEGGADDRALETTTADLGSDVEAGVVAPLDGLDVAESFDGAEDVPIDALQIESTALDDSLDVPELEPVDELPELEVPFSDDELEVVSLAESDDAIEVIGLDEAEESEIEVPVDDLEIDMPESISVDVPWDVEGRESRREIPEAGTPVLVDQTEVEQETGFDSGIEVPDLDIAGLDDFGADEEERAEDGAMAGALDGLPMLDAEAPSDYEDQDLADTEAVGEVEGVGALDISALEFAVADDPDAPGPHRDLGEALLELGDRDRGIQELDFALEAYQAEGDLRHAQDVVDEILRLDSNSVHHHQKRVEFALHRGDDVALVAAYLALADALVRTEQLERAKVVYERVLERDPDNESAQISLETLVPAPVEAEPEAAVSYEPEFVELAEPERAEEPDAAEVVEEVRGPAAAEDEVDEEPAIAERAAAESEDSGGFVDLGALIFDEEEVAKDTRMRIDRAEPEHQEQQDFAEMLSEFKKGIEANIDADDAQAHYDLGVAFKEMGLLDEAISEFQKALRGAQDRLRTSESLGLCFFEKGQYAVAATVLRRAIDSEPGADDQKIGLLYWLGRCEEEQGRSGDALAHYQRIFSIDINFQDVSDRVNALSDAGS